MPTPEQARQELRRRAAQTELDRRAQPTFGGGQGGEFRGQGAGGSWEPETAYDKVMGYEHKLRGAGARGTMQVGRAVLGAPSAFVKQVGLANQWADAERVLSERDPQKQTELIRSISQNKQAFDKTADWLSKPANLHKEGMETIIRNHPEWKSNPPESFIDLVKNPDKLGVALAEALPLLAGAGIMVAAGQPQMAAGLMYVTEGQNASDQAIADGASEDEAATAYGVYGTVAAALETMQLQGIIKVAKGSYNALLNRTVQKVAKGGLRTAVMGTIKVSAQEALEEMSQGAWQEITAKMVYDKDIPGGVADFIDRRAQEAYIGGAMGLIPGVAGGVTGRVQGGPAVVEPGRKTPYEPEPGAVEQVPHVSEAVDTTGLPPINVYKTVSDSRTGITEEEVVRKGERYVDSVTGEDVILDTEASGSAIAPVEPVEVKGVEAPAETKPARKMTKEEYLRSIGVGMRANDPRMMQASIDYEEMRQAGTLPTVGQAPVAKATVRPVLAKPVEAPEPVTEAKPKLSRKKALKLGHDIPKALDWDEAQRRDFMQQTVGKPSMKGMKPAEMRTLVEALQGELRAAGLEYTPEPSPVDELVSTLQETKKVTELEPSEELKRGKVRQLGRRIKSGAYSFVTGLERMERFFESLDAHKKGAFTENIWRPVQQADELSTENANQDLNEFTEHLASQNIDTTLWLGKAEQIGDTKWSLTPFQKIGTYMLAQNKNGRRQLTVGMGFSESDLTQVIESITPQEKAAAEWLLEKYDQQWDVLKQVAAQSGMDPAKLKKELHYSPIIRTDADLETQEDFLSGLSDAFTGEAYDPEHKFLEPRKPSARGKVELDAAILYMHNIARTQRFLQMAPVANKVGRILNNKKFKQALNERTYGQGSRLVNKWMKDVVRGTVSQNTTQLSKMANIMRRNGIVYAIGYNIPSSLRQSLSLSNAVAVDKAMLAHVPANLTRATTPKGYKEMEGFVFSRSLQVKNSSFDRDLRVKASKKGLKLKLRGKRQWSQKAISWIRWMDRHTRVVAWKSLYDTGMGKFNDDIKASEYADKWVARTQPMANMKDLPHFFRGGTFEKLLTTFQNQVNNNANFYMYDILGAKKAGEISLTEAGHRVMFSYVLPAILFGMIGRGGLPKDIKDIAVDLATYPIAGAVVIGRWITRMIRGWGGSSTIAEAGPEEFQKFVGAAKRGDVQDIIKYAATTVGALTGRVPAQAVRTAEGAIDIAAGETTDPRRLIYSEWALEQGKKKKKKPKYSGGYIP